MMAKRPTRKRKSKNGISLKRQYISLGNLQAENDANLPLYFVDSRGYYENALATDSSIIIFKGDKGIGKSALLKMLEISNESNSKRVIKIGPDDLAFTALANLADENSISESNQWLYKCLWKYLFSVTLLRHEFPIESSLTNAIKGVFRTVDQKQAITLLRKSIPTDGTHDQGLTGIMMNLIDEVEIQLNAKVVDVKVKASNKGSESAKAKISVLNLVEQVSKSLPNLIQHEYMILIDDLDLHWINSDSQNTLIAALFSAISKFSHGDSKIKFVIAIRDDIFSQLPIENKDKSRDWITDIGWDKASLREVVDTRMKQLHKVSSSDIWDGLLPAGAFDKMVPYCINRPRLLIRLIQICFTTACDNGRDTVSSEDLDEAIRKFSREKLEDLDDEVGPRHPGIRWIIEHFTGKRSEFSLDELKDILLEIQISLDDENIKKPNSIHWANGLYEEPSKFAWILIDSGFLLVKTNRNARPDSIESEQALKTISNPYFAIRHTFRAGLRIVGT